MSLLLFSCKFMLADLLIYSSLNERIIKKEFEVYRPENLRKLYDYCIVNGFENQWTPRNHLRG